MKIETYIDSLIAYAMNCGLTEPEDHIVATNRILDLLRMDDYTPSDELLIDDLEEILAGILAYAVEKGLCDDGITAKDIFDTRIMGALTPMPREVIATFRALYEQSPEMATDWYYQFSCDTDYIRRYRIAKDMRWKYESEYGQLDITINLSKPEKDPKAIAAAKNAPQTAYPKCQLCVENEGYHFNISDLQQILGAMSDKANVANTIQVITTIDTISADDYDDGQYFYDLSAKEYYYIDDGSFKLVENSSGILGSDRVLIRYSTSDEALNWNGLLDTLYEIVGSKLCIVNYSNKDYLVQFTKKLLVTEEPGITIFDLATKCLYYKETITDIDTFALIITSTYKIEYVEKKSTINTVYGINASAQQTNVPYGVLVVNNALVQRGETGQIIVPQTPTADTHATSKKYVDDSIATIKSNQFIIVDTTTFPTLEDFLDSTGEEGYIYLYPINLADLTKGYYQYIWEGNDWLDIGTTQIDLSNYYTKPQVDSIANGKVDKTSSASKLYGTNASGNQTTISFTSSNNGSTIPLRDNDGNVGVALTPTNNMHATSKYYVDAQLSLKVDKTSGSNKVYGTDSSGNQKTFDIDNTVGADGNIVRRASVTSQIMVPLTPTANGHASSKKYVDDSVANAISNVYKIKGSKTVAEINALTDMHVGDVYNLLDSGEITLGELQVFTGDNIVWLGSAWDKLGAEIDWHAYDEKFMAAGFFEVEEYDEDTGEVTIVYATELYDMSYNGDTGVMTIEAN